jgi:hypothetical protein
VPVKQVATGESVHREKFSAVGLPCKTPPTKSSEARCFAFAGRNS